MINNVVVADWGKLRLVSRWRSGVNRGVSLTTSIHCAQWFDSDKAEEVKAHMESEGREVRLFNSLMAWGRAKDWEQARRKEGGGE